MISALYTGKMFHERTRPVIHRFSYSISMVCLALDELDTIFDGRRFWSTKEKNIRWFRREDHFGDHGTDLDLEVRSLVEKEAGFRPDGKIFLVTQLRNWGQIMNPVCFYYCWTKDETRLSAIVAEVRNTPWRDIHCYVLIPEADQSDLYGFEFSKDFHVSPFMPMDQEYRWKFTIPGDTLAVQMENLDNEGKLFTAGMKLNRKPINGRTLAGNMIAYPWCTLKTISAIYWNALLLRIKGAPYFPHPSKSSRRKVQND